MLCPCSGFKKADKAHMFISTFLKIPMSFMKKLIIIIIINEKSIIALKKKTDK